MRNYTFEEWRRERMRDPAFRFWMAVCWPAYQLARFNVMLGGRPWRFWTRLRYVLTGNCGLACGYEPLFGCFMPEAGCPVHNRVEGAV